MLLLFIGNSTFTPTNDIETDHVDSLPEFIAETLMDIEEFESDDNTGNEESSQTGNSLSLTLTCSAISEATFGINAPVSLLQFLYGHNINYWSGRQVVPPPEA